VKKEKDSDRVWRETGTTVAAAFPLGHSSAATTQTYLSRIGASDAVAFAQESEWN
jgi:hypothetical protein